MTPLTRCTNLLIVIGVAALISACASKPPAPNSAKAGARSGAYYKDDGPSASVPADIDRIPDAVARTEPLHRFANRPYNVFGVDYRPMTSLSPLRQRGIASWYGRKFHGQKTAIGETYDMFAMTAAHPTAPLPSFARVTHTKSGRSVVVRINDRGPFHPGRIVDLSYAAARRLGIAQGGSGEVQFDLLVSPFQSAAPGESVIAFAQPPPVPVAPADPPAIAISPIQPSSQDFYYVQLGAFGNFANAQAFQQRMSIELATTPRVQQVDSLFRVRLGPFTARGEAEAARDRAQSVLSTPLIISSTFAR